MKSVSILSNLRNYIIRVVTLKCNYKPNKIMKTRDENNSSQYYWEPNVS